MHASKQRMTWSLLQHTILPPIHVCFKAPLKTAVESSVALACEWEQVSSWHQCSVVSSSVHYAWLIAISDQNMPDSSCYRKVSAVVADCQLDSCGHEGYRYSACNIFISSDLLCPKPVSTLSVLQVVAIGIPAV